MHYYSLIIHKKMARSILQLTNVDPADSDYPRGRVRNNPGDNSGTPVNEALLGDMAQFFQQIMDEAGITPNQLPDNEYSGWQLFEAYKVAMFGGWELPSTYVNDYIAGGSNPVKYRKVGKTIKLKGKTDNNTPAGVISSQNVFTLPIGYRPAETQLFTVAVEDGSNPVVVIEITSAGVVKVRGDLVPVANDACYLNLSFDID